MLFTNFNELILGETFTFVIGEEQTEVSISSKVVAENSAVLNALINNGKMEESITKRASLPEVELATFMRFVEFLFTGTYRNQENGVHQETPFVDYKLLAMKMMEGGHPHFFCGNCGKCSVFCDNLAAFPTCGTSCEKNIYFCVVCGNTYGGDTNTEVNEVLCKVCEDRSFGKYANGWKELFRAEYEVMNPTHRSLELLMQHTIPPDPISNDLLSHAKVYVFADIYDVPALTALSLHKLHRNLVSYPLRTDTIPEFVRLLQHVYALTLDSEEKGEEFTVRTLDPMRYLVRSYAIYHHEQLFNAPTFRALLEGGGQLATDFPSGLRKHMGFNGRS